MDGRKRRYVPLDVLVAHGNLAVKLRHSFGNDGVLAWVLLLAAAKRSPDEGTFTYVSEEEAWRTLGMDKPEFTMEEFLRRLGQLKKTSRTRRGHVVNVSLTRWGERNDDWRRQREAERLSSKRAQSTATKEQRSSNGTDVIPPRAREVEVEVEENVVTAKAVTSEPPKKPRKPDPLWDALAIELGVTDLTATERGRRNTALKELRGVGATSPDIHARCQWWRTHWPDITLTAMGLAANWSTLSDQNGAAATIGRPGYKPSGPGEQAIHDRILKHHG